MPKQIFIQIANGLFYCSSEKPLHNVRSQTPQWAAEYVVILSRLQFAITTLFHILWPVLTIRDSLVMLGLGGFGCCQLPACIAR